MIYWITTYILGCIATILVLEMITKKMDMTKRQDTRLWLVTLHFFSYSSALFFLLFSLYYQYREYVNLKETER